MLTPTPSGSRSPGSRSARAFALVVVAAALVGLVAAPAQARWTATSAPGTARAVAMTLPAIDAPVAILTGPDVELSWSAGTAVAVDGYEVVARDTVGGGPRTVGGTCAGTVTTLSCTDADVPIGSWEYSIVPRLRLWTGPPSPVSAPVDVP